MKAYARRLRPFNKEVIYNTFYKEISGLKMQIQADGSHTREAVPKTY